MLRKKALIILVKNPIPGKTKTRLAATVGNDKALKMYGILTRWTANQAAALKDVSVYVYYSNQTVETDEWSQPNFVKRVQRGDDLGARMEHAIAEVFNDGQEKVIIIGTDCPGVTTTYLQEAFAMLNDANIVLGPALDGGYTLLGMKTQPAPLFTGVDWSTEKVASQTIALAEQSNLTVKQLAPLSDIDYVEDWYSYGWTLPD